MRSGRAFQPTQTLTLSVARWLSVEVSTLIEGRFIAPESALKRGRRARATYAAHRLRHTTLATQSAFDWVDPMPFEHQVGHSRGTSRSTMRGSNTCFTTRRAPPCQGDGSWLAATSTAGTSKPVANPRRRCLSPISAVDLLSKEPKRPPSSRAWGLHPATLRDLY